MPRLRYRFIAHPEGRPVFPLARQNLFAVAEARGCVVKVEHEIRDGDRVVFEVLSVKRPNPGP